MDSDAIEEIGVDELGRLYVMPRSRAFPYIYREAMEVHWEPIRRFLYAPLPPRADLQAPRWWFQRILAAAEKQSCHLRIVPETRWHNVSIQQRSEFESSHACDDA